MPRAVGRSSRTIAPHASHHLRRPRGQYEPLMTDVDAAETLGIIVSLTNTSPSYTTHEPVCYPIRTHIPGVLGAMKGMTNSPALSQPGKQPIWPPHSAYCGSSRIGRSMHHWIILASLAQQSCPVPAVSALVVRPQGPYSYACTFPTGFFTLGVGRIARVESLTLVKIGTVITRLVGYTSVMSHAHIGVHLALLGWFWCRSLTPRSRSHPFLAL